MLTSFYTFGCTQNNYETQKLRELIIERGHIIIEDGEPDLIVINSCAVTVSAEKGARELAGRLRKRHPGALVALVGCYGELLKDGGEHFDIVLGNDKYKLIDIIMDKDKDKDTTKENEKINPSQASSYVPYQRTTQAFLHVQNGCSCACSYCIVPCLRGGSISKPLEQVMGELKQLLAQGYSDIVIAGINIGLYKSGGYELIDLLAEINSTKGLSGLRLCSLEPASLNERFVRGLPEITKLRPFFHIALQSGCNKTLALMRRGYTFEQFHTLVADIRKTVCGAAISTDVIAGFPGESGSDFNESCDNIAKCQFSDIHIFKYSHRPGTVAADMPNQISPHQKSLRAQVLEGIKTQACYNYNSRFIGSIVNVLIQKKRSDMLYEGVTEHNVKIAVTVAAPDAMQNEAYIDALVTGLGKGNASLFGEG